MPEPHRLHTEGSTGFGPPTLSRVRLRRSPAGEEPPQLSSLGGPCDEQWDRQSRLWVSLREPVSVATGVQPSRHNPPSCPRCSATRTMGGRANEHCESLATKTHFRNTGHGRECRYAGVMQICSVALTQASLSQGSVQGQPGLLCTVQDQLCPRLCLSCTPSSPVPPQCALCCICVCRPWDIQARIKWGICSTAVCDIGICMCVTYR